MTGPAELVADLRTHLGPGAVLTGADAAPHLEDARRHRRGEAVAVVRPADTGEVADVVRRCRAAGVAVVAQGGNTGMSGGAVPTARPSVVVQLTRMDRIESVDPLRWSLTARAGATIGAVHEAATAAGRMFAPDWGARGTATVGGAIATNAGGVNVLEFGGFRDHVLGLEVVLPDGRVWDGLRALRKDSSGIDLRHLVIGAEGTLGIVTRAVLRLVPALPHETSALAAVPDLDGLGRLLERARAATPRAVTAFELVPDLGVELVGAKLGTPRPLTTRAPWYVLVRFAAPVPVTDALAGYLADAAADGLVLDAAVATTATQEQALWTLRDELPPPSLFGDHAGAVKGDVAVPVDRVAELVTRSAELAGRLAPGCRPYAFGHVGDGNIHLHVLAPDPRGDWEDRRGPLQAALDELAWDLGGTISAEHGIGRDLVERIGPQRPAVEWELVRAIKAAVDPDGLCNPGVALPAVGAPGAAP